jgi:HSP20 family protein
MKTNHPTALSIFDQVIENILDEKNPFLNIGYVRGVNVQEMANEYQMELSLPGYKREDINIALDNDSLIIRSQVQDDNTTQNGTFYRRDFRKSSFEKRFLLYDDVNLDGISAKMEDGILVVTLPKIKPEEKPNTSRTININ